MSLLHNHVYLNFITGNLILISGANSLVQNNFLMITRQYEVSLTIPQFYQIRVNRWYTILSNNSIETLI